MNATDQGTAAHALLLRAALADGPCAVEAWQVWRQTNDLEAHDHASFRLLPQVYLNLSRLGAVRDAQFAKLRGVYRHAWMRNEVTLRATADTLRRLNERGIPALLVGGLPLILAYYRDAGARLVEIGLHFGDEHLLPGLDVLERAGWRSGKASTVQALAPFVPAIPVRHERWAGVTLRVHLHPFAVGCPRKEERELWQRATARLEVGDVSALAPDPIDLLLMACLRGREPDATMACAWIADAVTVIRVAGPALDWDQMLDRSRRLGLLSPVRAALASLHERFGDVPGHVVRSAPETSRSTAAEAAVHARLVHDSRVRRPLIDVVATHWSRYARGCRAYGRRGTPIGLLRYVLLDYQRTFDLDRPWRVPWRLAAEAARTMRSVVIPGLDRGAQRLRLRDPRSG